MGHSVERLCKHAGKYDPIFLEKVKTWSYLDGYYFPTRYPNGLPDGIPADVYTIDAANQAVDIAAEVVNLIKSMIT